MLYQSAHFGESDYFCKEYGENFSFPVHLHNSFELITVTHGEMTVTVDNLDYTLSEGEAVLIFPNQLHSLESKNSRHMLCIFSTGLVKAYFSSISEKIPENNRFKPEGFYIKALDKLLPECPLIEKKGVLYSLCGEFHKTAVYRKRINIDHSLLHSIFEFVEENFSGECSLISLAEKTGYSYSYLSRFFKMLTGLPFNSYVNRHRINNACYLLNNTDYSILQCAMESGYDSLRSFNRNFTAFMGISPREYRSRKK